VAVILLLFIFLNDLYALRGLRHLAGAIGITAGGSRVVSFIYWAGTLLVTAGLAWAAISFREMRNPAIFMGISVVMGIFLMLYVPKLVFNVSQGLGDLGGWLAGKAGGDAGRWRTGFTVPGLLIGLTIFFGFALGMLRGRTHVKVFSKLIQVNDLPASFSGLKIVQLSDIHLAGFHFNPGHMEKVVSRVNQLEPDLVLFTGDMVHNFAEELEPFTGILDQLKAPLGKYAVLGNHDYGHYYRWESPEAEAENLDRTKELIRQSGFDLLLNEHRTLSVGGDSLEIIGVENWGKPPFPQEGDLQSAMRGTSETLVKILLSHDPSHWDLVVRGKEPIALTLSGHTHGMQFGIEVGEFRWSPSAWTYKQWAGLYSENGQYLYVNRGLGFTGFPGRVGIRPEITLLTLAPGDSPGH